MKKTPQNFKKILKSFLKWEFQPMGQGTYWIIFVSCSYILAIKTIELSILGSYQIIEITPKVAEYSFLIQLFS